MSSENEVVPSTPLPKGMTIRVVNGEATEGDAYQAPNEPQRLEIAFAWSSTWELVLVIVVIAIVVGVIIFGYGLGIELLFSLFLFGLLGYPVLAGLVNSTVLSIDENELRVRHGPIPVFWRSTVTIPTSELRALKYVYHMDAMGTDYRMTNRVAACLKDGTEQFVLYDLKTNHYGEIVETTGTTWLEKLGARKKKEKKTRRAQSAASGS